MLIGRLCTRWVTDVCWLCVTSACNSTSLKGSCSQYPTSHKIILQSSLYKTPASRYTCYSYLERLVVPKWRKNDVGGSEISGLANLVV